MRTNTVVTGTKPFAKGGNARTNGMILEGDSNTGGSGKVRQNGLFPGASEHSPDETDPGKYLGPKGGSGGRSVKPSKTGSVR